MTDFHDRLDPATFSGDEPYGIALVAAGQPVGDLAPWQYLPERLVERMHALGRAYDLHVLSALLVLNDDARLNYQQCASLVEELDFLRHVLNDPALCQVADTLASLAARCAPGFDLLIESP